MYDITSLRWEQWEEPCIIELKNNAQIIKNANEMTITRNLIRWTIVQNIRTI